LRTFVQLAPTITLAVLLIDAYLIVGNFLLVVHLVLLVDVVAEPRVAVRVAATTTRHEVHLAGHGGVSLGLHGRVDVLLRVVLLRGLLSHRPRILDLADDQPAALRFLQSRRFFLALRTVIFFSISRRWSASLSYRLRFSLLRSFSFFRILLAQRVVFPPGAAAQALVERGLPAQQF